MSAPLWQLQRDLHIWKGLLLKALGQKVPIPLHKHETYNPFFIVGSGRCGTTLLRRILQASVEVHIPPETHVLGPVIRQFEIERHLSWEENVLSVLRQFEYHPESESLQICIRPLATRLLDTPRNSRSLAYILDNLYRYHGHETNQVFERWGEKTTMNAFYLEEIYSVFPGAQFVHVIRDGTDVVSSFLESGLQPDIIHAARRWKRAVRAIRKFMRKFPQVCYEIRYEDLVSDPIRESHKVFDFLGIRFDRAMVTSFEHAVNMGDVPIKSHHSSVLKPITKSNIGKGRRSLSQDEKKDIDKIIGKDLTRFGYKSVRQVD